MPKSRTLFVAEMEEELYESKPANRTLIVD